uniref:Uncharacterized protein n=1 Tax=Podoviridae sp. ctoyw14 TaxID=2826578 RepID=A0A8S5LVJ9_9CAUD|nr:MAG TPA: hypothetical protein [Podoviridae sp. ctoyw14]
MSDSYFSYLCDIYQDCNAALSDCLMPCNCLKCKYRALCADIRRLREKVKGAIDSEDL